MPVRVRVCTEQFADDFKPVVLVVTLLVGVRVSLVDSNQIRKSVVDFSGACALWPVISLL